MRVRICVSACYNAESTQVQSMEFLYLDNRQMKGMESMQYCQANLMLIWMS